MEADLKHGDGFSTKAFQDEAADLENQASPESGQKDKEQSFHSLELKAALIYLTWSITAEV